MAPKAIAAKVAYVPGTAFFADGNGSSTLRLSYCHPTPERIKEGVFALSKVVRDELKNAG
jgi:DNA-binding transcriptional MocR family regulator